jgi:hypothetical protein
MKPHPASSRDQRGFNLIEAAIVLGVVGLVIGGIWIAASAVQEANRYRNLVGGFGFIVTQTQSILPASVFQGSDIGIDGISMGIWPKDWVNGTSRTNPYGGNSYITATNMFGPVEFRVSMERIPLDTCLKFMAAIDKYPNYNGGSIEPSGQSWDGVNGNYLSWRQDGCRADNVIHSRFLFTRQN